MKIFNGFEEIEILPWYECKDCSKHSRFSARLDVRLFLERLRLSQVAMDSLRRLIQQLKDGLQITNDYRVLEQVAHMVATSELHVTRTRLDLGVAVDEPTEESAPPAPAAGPEPRSAPAPPPPPQEPVFLANVDSVAIAQALAQAARSGVPFCEE